MPQTPETTVFPSDDDVRERLVKRLDQRGQGVGVVVGVVDASGRRVIAHGDTTHGGGRPVGGDTLFEIGSATKVFTTLLLAEMAERGEVALDDPIARYLPAGVTAPTRGGREITLIDLATHTAGLPPMDPGFRTTDPANPRALVGQAEALARYSAERLYAFLSAFELKRDIGARYVYSNLGLGLLGHLLALRAGAAFETLLRQRITGPLGMTDTVMTPDADQRRRLALPHNQRLQPRMTLRLDVLAGAGALRSTANDLLTFLAAELGFIETPLRGAMAAQLAPRRPTNLVRMRAALGWHVIDTGRDEIIGHGGATVGSVSYIAFDRQRRCGVVALNNARGASDENLAWSLLTEGRAPARAGSLDPTALDAFIGRYALWSGSVLEVTRVDDQLLAQLTVAGRQRPVRRIHQLTPTRFGWDDANMEVTFVGEGRASEIVMHSADGDRRCPRLA
ncbi:MAG TPA: serine hydrolase [Caulobacteraceae bacterium]|jgi:CubicO group peptidase (beta-lactamase class C family)